MQTALDTIRLNLGCGHDVRPGHANVDKFPVNDDVVQADFPLLPFPDNYANEALLSHVLEHFGYADGLTLCREIHRVLKPGGIALIEVPDIAWCMAQFLGAPETNGYTDPKNDYSTTPNGGYTRSPSGATSTTTASSTSGATPRTGCCTRWTMSASTR
jgi:predicted SAM-dependent methyltransferase